MTIDVPAVPWTWCRRSLTRLRLLEAIHNDGRGVVCVRAVICHLERNDLAGARLVANLDHDKIRSYPKIEQLLKHMLWEPGTAPTWWCDVPA